MRVARLVRQAPGGAQLGALLSHRAARVGLAPTVALQRRAAAVVSPPEQVEQAQALGRRTTALPIDKAKGLPLSFYTDGSIAKQEFSTIFGSQWFCIGHTVDVPEPNSVKVVNVGGTSILLTRDRRGELHALYNVCRHRGARVCREDQTGCKQLTCPYHWWSYRLDGSLKAAPPMAAPPQGTAERAALGLRRLRMEVFAGMVFVNQSAEAPPLREALGDLPEKLARYDFDDLVVQGVKDYNIKGNWKAIAENFLDFYHLPPVHPLLAKYLKLEDHKPYQGKGQYVGYVTTDTALNADGGPGDSSSFNLFPRITESEAKSTLFFVIFPNVCITVMPHSAYTLISYPTEDPACTKEVLTMLLPRSARLAGDTDEQFEEKRKALLDFLVELNDEDVVAIENLQDGLKDGSGLDMQPYYVPKYDWPVHRFHNLVLSGLQNEGVDESFMPEYSQEFPQRLAAELRQSPLFTGPELASCTSA